MILRNIQIDKQSFKERIYLKGKESFLVGILLIIAIIIFIVPIVSIFLLRVLFKYFNKIRKKATALIKTDPGFNFESKIK